MAWRCRRPRNCALHMLAVFFLVAAAFDLAVAQSAGQLARATRLFWRDNNAVSYGDAEARCAAGGARLATVRSTRDQAQVDALRRELGRTATAWCVFVRGGRKYKRRVEAAQFLS